MKKGSNEPAIEIWELPSWAADTIAETIAYDATSKMFAPTIRAEIAKASEEMRWVRHEYLARARQYRLMEAFVDRLCVTDECEVGERVTRWKNEYIEMAAKLDD